MGVPAYMLSILHRQQQLLKDGFIERYPTDWLIWEPGPWRPARSVLESNLESTQLPRQEQERRPCGDDAICFQLKAPKEGGLLRVGRATTNDIVINDLTASREQFSLRLEKRRWYLIDPHGQVLVNGAPVRDLVELRSGARITLGEVELRLLSATDMATRAGAYLTR